MVCILLRHIELSFIADLADSTTLLYEWTEDSPQ